MTAGPKHFGFQRRRLLWPSQAPGTHNLYLINQAFRTRKCENLHFCATRTTCVWGKSSTLVPLMERMMSPTARPDCWAGVPGSVEPHRNIQHSTQQQHSNTSIHVLLCWMFVFVPMADTTTGREPWMRKPNSPPARGTATVLLHSEISTKYCKYVLAIKSIRLLRI